MNEPQFFYRYEDVQYACAVDEFDNIIRGSGRLAVELRQYRVLKVTPRGCWVRVPLGRRFVLAGARKRFACPTVAEAAESFRARKEAQRRIYLARADRAERALELLDRLP